MRQSLPFDSTRAYHSLRDTQGNAFNIFNTATFGQYSSHVGSAGSRPRSRTHRLWLSHIVQTRWRSRRVVGATEATSFLSRSSSAIRRVREISRFRSMLCELTKFRNWQTQVMSHSLSLIFPAAHQLGEAGVCSSPILPPSAHATDHFPRLRRHLCLLVLRKFRVIPHSVRVH